MLKIILILLWSTATFAGAGIGGIDGGSVHFQKNSTWVNMVYSKKLCFKNDSFYAPSIKCTKWKNDGDRRKCVKQKPIIMVQPKYSTRQRCKKMEDDKCVKWLTVPLVQKPDRVVKFLDDDRRVIRVEKLRVKSCK